MKKSSYKIDQKPVQQSQISVRHQMNEHHGVLHQQHELKLWRIYALSFLTVLHIELSL